MALARGREVLGQANQLGYQVWHYLLETPVLNKQGTSGASSVKPGRMGASTAILGLWVTTVVRCGHHLNSVATLLSRSQAVFPGAEVAVNVKPQSVFTVSCSGSTKWRGSRGAWFR